ncbi:hypothetical protein ABGB12_04500 [Actinocorallia sp. B10E7]|uniref:hypothetical protein n=1 Tax=Actinocorallia sp. B10E7 TaxID=3153558 RepID=UPI00325D9EC9
MRKGLGRPLLTLSLAAALVGGTSVPAFAAYRDFRTSNAYADASGFIIWKGRYITVDVRDFETGCVSQEPVGRSYLYLSYQEKVGKKWKKRNKSIASLKQCGDRDGFKVKTKVKGSYKNAKVTVCTDAASWVCGRPG